MLAKKMLESIPRSIRTMRKLTISVLDGQLTFHQTRVLFFIKDGLGQSQIAETLQVTPAAVCKLMHQLTDRNLILMNPGEDRRARKIELTKEGSKVLNSVSRSVEKKLNKGIDSLSNHERDDLMKGLQILDKLIGQIKEG
ncbi:MAG: MarR family transcriptional regulator [Bdellovibrionota bacterium]